MTEQSNKKLSQRSFAEETLEYLDALYGFAMILTRDSNIAADLVQETYVHSLRSWQQYTPGTTLKSWMFVILRNIWINQYRRAQNGPQFISMAHPERDEQQDYARFLRSKADSPETALLRSLQVEQIRTAIESLPEVYREVILLREMEGFSYLEISTILSIAEGTVMSRLNRARQQLRALLADVLG